VPTASGVVPASVGRGGPPVTVELHGTRFAPGTGIASPGRGVAFTNVVVVDPTTIRITVTVASDAPTGPRDLFVVGPPVVPDSQVGVATTVCAACLTIS
jgi:hypothetical protein